MRLVPPVRWLKRSAWAAVMCGAAVSGLVSAQPAPPSGPVTTVPQAAPLPPPGTPVPEEAPPISVPPPAPIVVPPITEKEVAPAPPKAETVEKAPEAPVRRARYDTAILQALDKVTAETLRFEAAVGRPVRYKNLVFTVRACERSAPDEAVQDSVAYLTIDSQPRAAPGRAPVPARQAFKGWMYASSPGLNPMEHPVYDAWLISCRSSAPVTAPVAARPAVAASTPVAKAPAPKTSPAAAPAGATPPAKASAPVAKAPAPAAAAPKAASPEPKAAPAAPAPPAPAPDAAEPKR